MKEEIEDIIWRDSRDECSGEEKACLREWLEASDENKRAYKDIRSIIQCGALLKGYDRLDKPLALGKVMKQR